jgi:hypothetical protein
MLNALDLGLNPFQTCGFPISFLFNKLGIAKFATSLLQAVMLGFFSMFDLLKSKKHKLSKFRSYLCMMPISILQ